MGEGVGGGEFGGLGSEFKGSGTLRAPSWLVLGVKQTPPPFGWWARLPPSTKGAANRPAPFCLNNHIYVFCLSAILHYVPLLFNCAQHSIAKTNQSQRVLLYRNF